MSEVNLEANIKIAGDILTATITDSSNGVKITISATVSKIDDAIKDNIAAVLDVIKNLKP